MDNLLSCPFCGGSWLTVNINDRSPNLFPFAAHVLCLNCLASVGSHGFEQTKTEAEAEAISAWNRRAQPESNPLTLDELRGMAGELYCELQRSLEERMSTLRAGSQEGEEV